MKRLYFGNTTSGRHIRVQFKRDDDSLVQIELGKIYDLTQNEINKLASYIQLIPSTGLEDAPLIIDAGAGGGGGTSNVAGYDGIYISESSDQLYKRNDAGSLTPVSAAVTLNDASVGPRHLSRAAANKLWLPSEVVCESFPLVHVTTNTLSTTSLRARLAGNIVIPIGKTITAIEFWSGGTAFAGVTHLYFGLYDQSFNLLATSADASDKTWGAGQAKRLDLITPYVAAVDMPVYAALLPEATTMGTLLGSSSISSAVASTLGLGGVVPTTPMASGSALPNPIQTFSAGSAVAYARLIGS